VDEWGEIALYLIRNRLVACECRTSPPPGEIWTRTTFTLWDSDLRGDDRNRAVFSQNRPACRRSEAASRCRSRPKSVAETPEGARQMPVISGAAAPNRHTAAVLSEIREWWPNQLTCDPSSRARQEQIQMGEGFSTEEQKLDAGSLAEGSHALMTKSRTGGRPIRKLRAAVSSEWLGTVRGRIGHPMAHGG